MLAGKTQEKQLVPLLAAGFIGGVLCFPLNVAGYTGDVEISSCNGCRSEDE